MDVEYVEFLSKWGLSIKEYGELAGKDKMELIRIFERKFPASHSALSGSDPVAVINKVIGKEMTENEVHCLFNHFLVQADHLSRNAYYGDIAGLYRKIANFVKSATGQSVKCSGYHFGEPLPSAGGQDSNAFQFVQFHSQLLCAKIGSHQDMLREWIVSERVHVAQSCPTVMRIKMHMELSNNRLALICPFYPAAVSSLPAGQCSVAVAINVALCTLSSIAAFRQMGLSHNDVKPSNLMLTSTSQRVILIDFGSSVNIGSCDTSGGTTPMWGRDCAAGTAEYDMACLASTLYYLYHGEEGEELGLQELADLIAAQRELHIVDTIILDCIRRPTEDLHSLFEEWVAMVESIYERLGTDTVVDYANVWPIPKCDV